MTGQAPDTEMSQKYKTSSQKWNILFANRGKVRVRTWQPIASSHEGIMEQISNQKIMIVGRDSHFSYLLQRFVRTSAHRVIPVNHSDDVLSLARCEKPVAIVLEVDKPEIVGWQTLRTLKSDPEARRIPVIVCSWLDESARSLAEGADVYLRMPILYREFGAALAAILTQEENGQSH
jgi:DNA-binding response OmpR family regulator